MHRILLALTVLGLLAGFASGRPDGAAADPAIVGYPDSMAALGDSITRAFNANGTFGEQPANVWATGSSPSVNSVYSRFVAVHPAMTGNAYNDSVSGAQMTNLNAQAANAVAQGADLVLILMGANDVCTSSEATLTPTATLKSQLQTALNTLSVGLPDSRILVFSIPDIYNLWNILHNDNTAASRWTMFGICQSMLLNPQSTAPADETRRLNVRQRNMDDNDAIRDACAEYAHCIFDNYIGFNTPFTPAHVSTLDYFHPSVAGEALIAQLAWDNFPDFTEVTPPVSDSSATAVPTGVSVTLTATDDTGVNGIEYKIGTGNFITYSAPFTVALGANVTWRAVDINGNIEATHTCRSNGWAWPAGDADCDGFPGTTGIPNGAPETYIGTDPAVPCAATSAANDETTTDAWPADFNDNQIVNGQDVGRFAPAYGNSVGSGPFGTPPLPGERFDFSGNGVINGQDIGKFSAYYGRSCA
jgi:lysophospholipase L1-like esterase